MAKVSNESSKRNQWGPHGSAAVTFGATMEFRNISHSYFRVEAVRDVNFQLNSGEIVCLLGPSGCGKTTLLRIAAGVERPSGGEVFLDGKKVAGKGIFIPPEQRNVGLMFQDFALFPHLTIVENIAFGLNGLSRKAALSEANLALKRVGLVEHKNEYPSALSGGEQQRVALARALVPRPAIMLMDEPFSGLDQRLRDSVRHETLALLKETRATSMLVTHDPVEAMGLADRILLMRHGELIQTGKPADLYRHPIDAEAARFFSDYNEFSGIVNDKLELETEIGPLPVSGFRPNDQVLAMLRPQGVKLYAATNKDRHVGRVMHKIFLGDRVELSVQFQGLDHPVIARVEPDYALAHGDLCTLRADPSHILFFAN